MFDNRLNFFNFDYFNYRTRSPEGLTNFLDFPDNKNGNKSTAPHFIVLKYFKNYTKHFHLTQFIRVSSNHNLSNYIF